MAVQRRNTTDVVVLHDEPDGHPYRLRTRFPTIRFHVCTTYADLSVMLDQFRPQVVFATNFQPKSFPRSLLVEHRCIEWLALGFSGLDGVTPWDDHRLVVTNSAGVASHQIAQYVVGAIFGFYQRTALFARHQFHREWCFESIKSTRDARVGIIGLGNVGRAVAELCRANGLRTVACRSRTEISSRVDAVFPTNRLAEMLAQIDVAVVCAALTPTTRDLFDHDAFAAMKRGSFFINVARGAIVQENALLAALHSGHLAGAHLDVVREEPLPPHSPLWMAPNCVITPHVSGQFEGWFGKAIEMFADNLDNWLAGRELVNCVSPVRGF